MASPNWLLVVAVAVVAGLTLVGAIVASLILIGIRARSNRGSGRWQAPLTRWPGRTASRAGPADRPISKSAHWDGEELVVEANEWTTKSLFDVPLNHCDQCVLTYRFRIRADRLSKSVYPELWCRVPERGQFFSRGVDRKLRQAGEWREVELPFYLQSGQQADLLHLNLAFEGPALVRLKDIEVRSTPLKPSA